MLKNAFGFTTAVDIFNWPEQAEQMSSLLGKKLIVIFMYCIGMNPTYPED